jgi:hypothetical protein
MFSLGVQHQLSQSVIAVLQYAGSIGWDQSDDRHINTLPLSDLTHRQEVANGTANANLYRQFPGFADINQEENETNFSYDSLQAGLRMENRHGLTVQLAYTYSHEIDEVSYDLNGLSNPFEASYDKGSGALDRRHIFNANYIYNLPFFAHTNNILERTTLGGWQVSGVTVAESGTPQALTYTGTDTLGLGGGTTNRPDQIAKVNYPKKRTAWFSTSSFANPLAPWDGGTNQGFGTSRKDAVVLPGRFNFNLSLFKTIPLKLDGPSLELRFESFNTFNHTQFNAIDANTGDSNFGQVTSSYDPRTLQLGAKFHF